MYLIARAGDGWQVFRGEAATPDKLFLISRRRVNEHVQHHLLDREQVLELMDLGQYISDEVPEFHD